jgi:hypothetical protein
MSHDSVSSGNATYKRCRDRWFATLSRGDTVGGGKGTMGSVMNVFASLSGTDVTVRAAWVVACAVVALAVISRMKPATPRRPAVVRVDNKPTPLYKEPQRNRKWQSAGFLGAGSLITGAVIACIFAFILLFASNALSEFGR